MPATPNLRGKRLPGVGYRPNVGLEALEPRALLSAAGVCPPGDAGVANIAAVSAKPAGNYQPADRAAAIAEAMKELGLTPPASTDASSATTSPAATPASSTRSHKRRRARPDALRAHHSTASTPPAPAPNTSTAVPFIFPSAVAADEPGAADVAGDSVLRAAADGQAAVDFDIIAGAPAALPRETIANQSQVRAKVSAAASPQLPRGANPFGTAPITETFLPQVATRLARASSAASSVLGLAAGHLPDWLIVGPQGQYVFSDRELFFKASSMVLGVAGLVAGYCSYLQVTRARRQAEAKAKVQIYSLFGWQESF